MAAPRLYNELIWVWPFVSPPEDYVEEVASFHERFMQHGVPDGASVLHLGCGGGSIDYHLKRHYRVTGVDISANMLDHARTLNPEVEYRLGDIRTVQLDTTFDAVLLHDASAYMTTLDDLLLAYRTAARHLKPGGVLVTPPEELRSRFEQHSTETWTRSVGDTTVTTCTIDYDPDPTDTEYEQTFVFAIRQGHELSVEVDTHHCGLFHLDDMLDLLRQAGFEPEVSRWELSDLPEDADYPLVTAVKRG